MLYTTIRRLFSFCWLLMALPAVAQNSASKAHYPISDIPDSLLKNADYVTRLLEKEIEFAGEGKAYLSTHKVVTILNKAGLSEAYLELSDGGLIDISRMNCKLYDRDGKLIREAGMRDMKDGTNTNDMNVTEDPVKSLYMSSHGFPYTLEWSYEIKYQFMHSLPPLAGISECGASLQRAVFTIKSAEKLPYKHKSYNGMPPSTEQVLNGQRITTWLLSAHKAIKCEPHLPPVSQLVPRVAVALPSFKMAGQQGSTESWAELGAWYANLNENRRDLGKEDIAKAKAIIQAAKTKQQAVADVYTYMQNTTRYTSRTNALQGFVSMKAAHVAETGWGDCKALTNYTQALLAAGGIVSYPVLLGAGAFRVVDPTFPTSSFNHVLLAVPNDKDTIFLECTSNRAAANYLNQNNGYRKGLLCSVSGGGLINLPGPPSEQNRASTTATLRLDGSGNVEGKLITIGSGTEQSDLIGLIVEDGQAKVNYLHDFLSVSNPTISTTRLDVDKANATCTLNGQVSISSFASRAGNKLLLHSICPFATPALLKDTLRQNPVWFQAGQTYVDSSIVELPVDFKVQKLPTAFIAADKDFYNILMTVQEQNNRLILTRTITIKAGQYTAAQGNTFAKALRLLHKASRQKVVLIPNASGQAISEAKP